MVWESVPKNVLLLFITFLRWSFQNTNLYHNLEIFTLTGNIAQLHLVYRIPFEALLTYYISQNEGFEDPTFISSGQHLTDPPPPPPSAFALRPF